MKWNDDCTITVVPPRKPKKITGTRFAAILGLNQWSTPFEAWCAITRTYEKPFEDTVYTVAGKTIEPKQADYMAQKYFWKKLIRPSDIWGEDYFNKTYGDFFPDQPICGGMWDYLFVDANGTPQTVLEMKTTKRSEDWLDDIPEYYAMQAALYAWLLNVDDVIMVCTILEDKDYQHPEDFQVTPENTFERSFKVSERYPRFPQIINWVEGFWKDHVLTGISPEYDEKKDAEILKELRSVSLNPDSDMEAICREAEELQEKLDKHAGEVKAAEKRLAVLKDMIKEKLIGWFVDDNMKQASITGQKISWVVTKSVTLKVDEEAMKQDGILDKYKTKESITYRLVPKAKGEK